MKKEIYFRRLPHPVSLAKIKQRFKLTPITVNGISVATIADGDEDVFQKCADMGFFDVRNKKL